MTDAEMTDPERWADMEARQCEKIADAIAASGRVWAAKELHASNLQAATVCAIKAETWREIARSLRQPYFVRLEREERGW